jgi:hypothetical protein
MSEQNHSARDLGLATKAVFSAPYLHKAMTASRMAEDGNARSGRRGR